MPEIKLNDLVKIFPYETAGLFASKQKKERIALQHSAPYTTNEGVVAVQHFSLEIESGGFVVLLGPSGCGKTTVLRMIAGLEEPTLGTVTFDGKDMAAVAPEDRNAAMVFQNYSLYPHLNVFDNIAFPLKNAHVCRAELEERVREAAELMKLTDKLKRLPFELSGGERQRVALARSLVRNPELFLMDEPFSNLDAPLRASLREYVRQMHRNTGATFVYVTHDRLEALSLATKLVVMEDGIIHQQGTPAELYNHPADSYVAGFLALPELNLYEKLHVRDRTVSVGGVKVPAPGAPDGAEVSVGIRPSDVRLGEGEYVGTVRYTEPSGSDTVVRIDCGGTELVALAPGTLTGGFFPNSKLRFGIKEDRVLLFDADGKTLR